MNRRGSLRVPARVVHALRAGRASGRGLGASGRRFTPRRGRQVFSSPTIVEGTTAWNRRSASFAVFGRAGATPRAWCSIRRGSALAGVVARRRAGLHRDRPLFAPARLATPAPGRERLSPRSGVSPCDHEVVPAALADPGPTRSFNGHRGDGAWRRRARRGRTRQAPGLAGVAVGLGAWPAWSGARALTRCRYLCAQRPRLAVRRPASAAGTGRTQRSGFGVALTCGTLSSITLGRADPGGPTATAAGGDGIQAADAGSEAPTDHGRWPTGTFWPASKTPCYADRK